MTTLTDKAVSMKVEEILDYMKETTPDDYLDHNNVNVSVLEEIIMSSDLPGIVKGEYFANLIWLAIRCYSFGVESGKGTFSE